MTEINRTLDTQAIATAYDYTPPPETMERVDLGIQWDNDTSHSEAFKSFDDISEENRDPYYKKTRPDEKVDLKFLLQEEKPTSKTPVRLMSFKNQRTGEKDRLSFELKEEDSEANLAQIYLIQDSPNQWNLSDRVIDPRFRKQGIASHMIQAAEQNLQARANKSGENQEITVNTAQLPVLNLFLKNGYEVIPEDEEAFLKVQNADPSLTLVSSPEDQEYQEKVWYLVEKAKYDAMGEHEFWELGTDKQDRTGMYKRESYRIRLRKIIKAKTNETQNTSADINTKITKALEEKSPSDRIKAYLSDHPGLSTPPQRERVNLWNMESIKGSMKNAAKKSISNYLKTDPNPGSERKNDFVLVDEMLTDGDFPIRLQIQKMYRWTSDSPEAEFRFQGISIQLSHGINGEGIAHFNLADYGDEFRIRHREVNPRYRKNGLANAAQESMEEFVKEYVRQKPEREPVITANAGQLNVWSMLSKQGFESTMEPVPVHPGESEIQIRNLEEVLTSLETEDGQYEVADRNFVYPSDFQGERWIRNEWYNGPNMDDAARIHFKKRLDVQSGNAVGDSTTSFGNRAMNSIKDLWN